MVLAHHDRAVALVLAQALLAQRAVVTVSAPLETVADFAAVLFFQPTALGVFFARRTNGFTLFDPDLKVLHAEAAFFLGRGLGRTNQFPALGLSLGQSLGGNVGAVHIQRARFFQAHRRLFLLDQRQSGVVTGRSRLSGHGGDEVLRRLSLFQAVVGGRLEC